MELVDAAMASPLRLASDAASDAAPPHVNAVDAPSRAASGEAENIAVCIRVRPLNDREVLNKDAAVLRALPALRVVSITDADGAPLPGKHNVFQYDHIFDQHASTRAMYARVAQRIVHSALDGINGTIFAYGQTSSGKTYTMTGTGDALPSPHEAPTSLGILQLAADDIFDRIDKCADRDFLLRVSFVEIYNEVVKDLLTTSDKGNNLKLREDPRKGVYVESKEEYITSSTDLLRLLHQGNERRTVGTTAMNDKSSRSHTIFRLVIESKAKATGERSRQSEEDVSGAVLVASLNLVDLAGSESMRHTGAEGTRQREAGNINKSLLTLSRVIKSLASNSQQNAPFRDSKLTRLLQNSLDGNTRTLIICCVTPSDRYLEETKSTLQFAARAKAIQTSASVNEVLDDQAQLKRLKREVHELKRLVNSEAYNALKAENEALQSEQSKNKAEMARLLGLVLSSSSASAVDVKPRHKRSRETWAPGDFSANKVLKSLRSDVGGSPNPQPRKRLTLDEAKENVDPQNLLSALNEADDDDDDDEASVTSRRASSSSSHIRAAAEEQIAQLVEVLEKTVCGSIPARFDHEEEALADQDLDARVTRLVTECEALAAVARQHERLTGDHEVLTMAVEELQMRLQLSKDQENEELDNTKQLLEHMKQELTEAREGAQLKDDEWQKEKDLWLLDRKQMESTIVELQSQLEAMSGLGRIDDVEQSLHEVTRQNDALKEELAQAKQAAEELQRTHVEKLAEVETNSKREIDELSSRLQRALQSLAAEQSSTRIEELEQELVRAQADVREADNNQEAEANRADDAVRELERLKQEMEELVQQHARALEETSSQRAAQDNESELQRLSELVTEKDRHIKQAEAAAAEARSYRDFLQAEMDELSGQLSALETAKTHFANENAQLRQKLSELNHEMLQVPETLAGELDQLTERIESLRSELDTKAAHEKILTTEIKKLMLRTEEQESELADKASEVARLQETVQALEEEKSVWLHKSASSDELHAELVRMREERWGLATKWEESEAALGKERRESQRLASELRDLESDHDSLEDEKDKLAETLAEKQTKLRQLASELDATQTEKSALEELASELESKVEILSIAKKSLDESLSVRVAELATRANENAELKTKLDVAESELQNLREQLERSPEPSSDSAIVGELQDRIQQLEAAHASSVEDLEESERAKSNLVEELSALEAQLMRLSEEKLDLQSKLDFDVNEPAGASDEASSLARDLKMAREELAQVGAARIELMEAQTQLQKTIDDLKIAMHEKEQELASAVATNTTPDDVVELTLRLETETQRRAKAEMDTKSYEEALDLMRDDFNHKLTALKSSQLVIQESNTSKHNLEQEVSKLRQELARAQEEQAELRYQSQQRLLSTQGAESVQQETVKMLKQELSIAKETLHNTEVEWKARAQQAEQQLRRLEADVQAAKEKELSAREKLTRVEEQLAASKDALEETESEWRARAQQSEQQFQRLEEELRSVGEERMRLAELVEQTRTTQDELNVLRTANEVLQAEKQQLEDHVDSRERQWAERVEDVTRKSHFENSSLREQYQEAQDEIAAFKQFAEGQIAELRACIEQNELEMREMGRAAQQQEASLQQHINKLESKLDELQALEATLREQNDSSGELVAELSSKVEQLTEQLSEVALERDTHVEQFGKLKSAMEKLEGEDYQHRNELEELSETLKSAQMETAHYHDKLVEVQAARVKLESVVEVQQKRIDKLEQVKMTKETLAVFQKLKSERQSLQVQVQQLEAQLKDATTARALTKEAAAQQESRLVRLKDEEVGMLKTHVEELKSHVEELKRTLANEKLRCRELGEELEEIRDKAQQEVEDMRAVAKEKSEQVLELGEQLDLVKKDQLAMAEHRSAKETYLEKENLELLVENRQLKKRLEGRAVVSNGSSYSSTTVLDDDVAAFEASAKAASALLAEPSAVSAYATSVTSKSPEAPTLRREDKASVGVEKESSASASGGGGGGLSSFLMASSAAATDVEEEEEARPACSQQ